MTVQRSATDDFEQIARVAQRLRDSLEDLQRAGQTVSLENFPCGCCADCSLLLGALLADLGCAGFKYICGERGTQDDGTWTSHAWLQRDTLVVDITGDQFVDAPAGVIVAHNSEWHKTFRIEREQENADFRTSSGPGVVPLRSIYEAVRNDVLRATTCRQVNCARSP